jgi:hypothetical protein
VNCKRLLISIVVAFVAIWVTDFVIHQVLLASTYGATKHLWRPEDEMMRRLPWMFVGQAIAAVGFTTIYAAFVAEKRSMANVLLFGVCVALFVGGSNVIMYAVQPFPGSLVVKWFVAALIQMPLVAIIISFVYKP